MVSGYLPAWEQKGCFLAEALLSDFLIFILRYQYTPQAYIAVSNGQCAAQFGVHEPHDDRIAGRALRMKHPGMAFEMYRHFSLFQ